MVGCCQEPSYLGRLQNPKDALIDLGQTWDRGASRSLRQSSMSDAAWPDLCAIGQDGDSRACCLLGCQRPQQSFATVQLGKATQQGPELCTLCSVPQFPLLPRAEGGSSQPVLP